jgi:hypothetical protein
MNFEDGTGIACLLGGDAGWVEVDFKMEGMGGLGDEEEEEGRGRLRVMAHTGLGTLSSFQCSALMSFCRQVSQSLLIVGRACLLLLPLALVRY